MTRRLRRAIACLAVAGLAVPAFLTSSAPARADATAQTLPFTQNWTNTNLITTANDWSGVPGIIGYRGDDLTTSIGVDPQTIVAFAGPGGPVVNVIVNQTNPSGNNTGAVGEFEITDVLNHYIPDGRLFTRIYEGDWTDAGTVPSLLRAAELARDDDESGRLAPPVERPLG